MADTPNISMTGGIRPISGGSSNNQSFQREEQPKKKKKPSNLRVGEILKGTIVERIDKDFARVKIPTGIFKALVADNLQRNDSLLFKVSDTDPQLVLKVYEVPTGSVDKPANPKAILRILDLAKDDFHLQLISKLVMKRNTIIRDDVLELYKLYTLIKDDVRRVPLDQVLELIIEMQLAELPVSKNLAIKLLPAFTDENVLSECLNSIHDNIHLAPSSHVEELASYFNYVTDNHHNKNSMFLLNKAPGHEKSFHEIMIKIDEMEITNTDIPRLQRNATKLKDFIAALGLWNIISFLGNAATQTIIPYFYEKQFYVVRVTQRKIHQGKMDPVSFSFSVPSDNLGEIKNKVLSFQKQLKLYMQAQDEKIVNSLNANQKDLKLALAQNEYNLSVFNIGIDDIKEEISEINKSSSGEHFTFVI